MGTATLAPGLEGVKLPLELGEAAEPAPELEPLAPEAPEPAPPAPDEPEPDEPEPDEPEPDEPEPDEPEPDEPEPEEPEPDEPEPEPGVELGTEIGMVELPGQLKQGALEVTVTVELWPPVWLPPPLMPVMMG